MASLVKRSIDKKVELLEATKTELGFFKGDVVSTTEVPDRSVQLEASKALDDILGVKAPPAKASVTVIHTLELPEWMRPDDASITVVNITGTVEDSA